VGGALVGEPLAQNITHQDAGYDCSAAQEFLPVGPARRPRPQLTALRSTGRDWAKIHR
jgi:hypothetical protein